MMVIDLNITATVQRCKKTLGRNRGLIGHTVIDTPPLIHTDRYRNIAH